MSTNRLGAVVGAGLASVIAGFGYSAVGLPWWPGVVAALVGAVGIDTYKAKRRKPLRADPRRIAQLEYDLGFTDEKPPRTLSNADALLRMHYALRHAGASRAGSVQVLHAYKKERHDLHSELAALKVRKAEDNHA